MPLTRLVRSIPTSLDRTGADRWDHRAHADAKQNERPVEGQPWRAGTNEPQEGGSQGCADQPNAKKLPRAHEAVEHSSKVRHDAVAKHELNDSRAGPHRVVAQELHRVLREVEQHNKEELADYHRTEAEREELAITHQFGGRQRLARSPFDEWKCPEQGNRQRG